MLNPLGGVLAQVLARTRTGQERGGAEDFFPWVASEDVVGAIHHALQTESLQGPVNVVSPVQTSRASFFQTLAQVLQRPSYANFAPSESRALEPDRGEGLWWTRGHVIPAALTRHHFRPAFPELSAALSFVLGTPRLPSAPLVVSRP